MNQPTETRQVVNFYKNLKSQKYPNP